MATTVHTATRGWRRWRHSEEQSTGWPRRRRIWVQHVESELVGMRIRVAVARAGGHLTPEQRVTAAGISLLLDRAQRAANRVDPYPSRFMNWWRGTLVEAAYRDLHQARAQMVDLYDAHELNAEIPGVIARVHSTMNIADPRRVGTDELQRLGAADQRPWLRRLISDSYDALDIKYSRLRNFRNVVLSAAVVLTLLTIAVAVLMAIRPHYIPLCFAYVGPDGVASTELLNCPSGGRLRSPQGEDVLVVGLLGLLGGALATSVAIRKIEGVSTPYDVPVALAWLKVPLGAFVAILGILGIRGGFVPGLSQLDTQDQILAYSLLFGFSQQLFTSVLDSKAQMLVKDLPSKESAGETRVLNHPHVTGPPQARPRQTGP